MPRSPGPSPTRRSASPHHQQPVRRLGPCRPLHIGFHTHRLQIAIDRTIRFKRSQIQAREVILMVHPHGVRLGVLLLLLAGRFRILRPYRQPLAIRRRSISGNVDGDRLECARFFSSLPAPASALLASRPSFFSAPGGESHSSPWTDPRPERSSIRMAPLRRRADRGGKAGSARRDGPEVDRAAVRRPLRIALAPLVRRGRERELPRLRRTCRPDQPQVALCRHRPLNQ